MIASTQTNHPLANVRSVPPATGNRLEAACQRLKKSGLRITQPRIAIINVLMQHEVPVSIEQIFEELDRDSCDLVTVYRCLGAFEEIGLVKRSFFHNGTSLYHLTDRADTVYHIACKETNAVTVLDPETTAEVSGLLRKVEKTLEDRGFTDITHMLEFFARAPQPGCSRETDTDVIRNSQPVIPEASALQV
ncbi:MAG: transcriptional repressor [Opitutaceae bacterium]|jgi:Fur family ferric uptake transcriptional regulator|nr:transcriptional repressor [Opitutaceae bacterium]